MEKTNKRSLITELIKTGNYTKAEIAAEIGMKVAGVSSQLTYLRWMGNYIAWDAEKKLQFVDADAYAAWEASRSANTKKAKTKSESTRTPSAQIEALEKTMAKQSTDLKRWEDKLQLIEADNLGEDLATEAQANITLLTIKMGRNAARLEELESKLSVTKHTVAEDDDVDDDANADDDGDEELL